MYRVVFVDDEPWALAGIRKSFDWNNMGFEVVAELADPIIAFNAICEIKPDVVFTDVRMPELTGIDLIKMIKMKGIDTEFVIISGYADFEYVQVCLRLGAFDYFLKPIQYDLVKNSLKKLFIKLEEKNISKNIDLYDELTDNNCDIHSLLNKFGMKCLLKYYLVVVITHSVIDIQIFYEHFLNLSNTQIIRINLGAKKHLLIVNSNYEIAEDIHKIYNSITSENIVNIGISTVSEQVSDLPRLTREADMAFYSEFITDKKNVYHYRKTNFGRMKELTDAFKYASEENSYTRLSDYLKGVPDFFITEELGINEVLILWNQLVSFFAGKSNQRLEIYGLIYMDYMKIVSSYVNFTFLCEYVRTVLPLLIGDDSQIFLKVNLKKTIHNNFDNLLIYVNNNYDKQLYLKNLANMFYINFTYCCELFKGVTGGTYSEYITKLRMNKACDLLHKHENTITEICYRVGYNNYSNFCRVFRKLYGVSPSRYGD